METSDWSALPQQVCDAYQFKDGDHAFSSGLHLEEVHDVLCRLKGCLLPDSNSPWFSTLPSDCLEQEGFPVQGIVFQPFHNTPGFH